MCCGCRSAWGCSYCTNRSSRIYSECLGELRRARNSEIASVRGPVRAPATDWSTRRRELLRALHGCLTPSPRRSQSGGLREREREIRGSWAPKKQPNKQTNYSRLGTKITIIILLRSILIQVMSWTVSILPAVGSSPTLAPHLLLWHSSVTADRARDVLAA